MDEARRQVEAVIARVLAGLGRAAPAVRSEMRLVEDLGLESLNLGLLLADFHHETGVDLFAHGLSATGIRTVGDLFAAYAQARRGGPADEAVRRGEARAARRRAAEQGTVPRGGAE